MRKRYEMTQTQLDTLLAACRSVPMIVLNCGPVSSPQENANRAWKVLGDELGFDHMTVQLTGEGERFFTAESKA